MRHGSLEWVLFESVLDRMTEQHQAMLRLGIPVTLILVTMPNMIRLAGGWVPYVLTEIRMDGRVYKFEEVDHFADEVAAAAERLGWNVERRIEEHDEP